MLIAHRKVFYIFIFLKKISRGRRLGLTYGEVLTERRLCLTSAVRQCHHGLGSLIGLRVLALNPRY
jgi:hypothetical protein